MLACYGGSFDPVHLGHLAIARAVRDRLGAEVVLVPAADPPHKTHTHADAEARAAMLELAIAGEPGMRVDRRELHREGPSYTIDTLRLIRAEQGPQRAIAWVVGGDSLLRLDSWHRWRELFAHGHVLAVERPGTPLDPSTVERLAVTVYRGIEFRRRAATALADSPAGGYAVLALPELRAESSTEVRRRIATGEDWPSLVPAAVAAHIRQHGLYAGGPGSGSAASL
nr:nicotinate-nucleotide adenylyltransferase [Luteimonas sp. MC1782]